MQLIGEPKGWRRQSWVCALILSACATYSGISRSEDRVKEVEQASEHFVKAFNNLDWAEFRKFFAEDATVFFPFPDTPRRAEGRVNVEARFREFFNQMKMASDGPPYLDIKPRDLAIQLHGDIAVVTFHLRSEPELNRRTVVFENRAGEWLIVHLHASVMVSPAEQ